MQACEKRVPPSSGAILTPIIVNFAENGTFWPSVKHKRLLFIARIFIILTCHTKHMFTYYMCKALTFVKGDNFGTISKI